MRSKAQNNKSLEFVEESRIPNPKKQQNSNLKNQEKSHRRNTMMIHTSLRMETPDILQKP
ncbi:MAG: hypothetical protein OXC46_10785 [Thaumarchaeota archaeon]|nr:hypothetical protein [Nitrososphaerota archaeon]